VCDARSTAVDDLVAGRLLLTAARAVYLADRCRRPLSRTLDLRSRFTQTGASPGRAGNGWPRAADDQVAWLAAACSKAITALHLLVTGYRIEPVLAHAWLSTATTGWP
jgi:hypothetical protein